MILVYPGHLLGVSYPSEEKQWVYYTAPVDWENHVLNKVFDLKLRVGIRVR